MHANSLIITDALHFGVQVLTPSRPSTRSDATLADLSSRNWYVRLLICMALLLVNIVVALRVWDIDAPLTYLTQTIAVGEPIPVGPVLEQCRSLEQCCMDHLTHPINDT